MIQDRELRYAASLLGSPLLAFIASVSLASMDDRLDGDLNQLPESSEPALMSSLEWALG